MRKISQALQNHITPMIFPEIWVDKHRNDRKVIRVCFKGDRQPYLAYNSAKDVPHFCKWGLGQITGGEHISRLVETLIEEVLPTAKLERRRYNVPRIRQADGDIVMNQDMYSEMLLARGGEKYSWENRVSDCTVADIDNNDFKTYLRKAKAVGRIDFEDNEPKTVLNKLGLVASDGIHLLNAGAALFCDCSTNDVQMAKFATNVKATFTDIRREDKGSIIGLSKICEQYIIDAMDWKADIVGLKRVETPEIPVEAIREAVINSYGHRLYDNNQCNEIDVFKDRIEIHTAGGFPKGHTPEEFFDGKKKAVRRNKILTGVLYYSKDMETFATGIKRIKDLCDEAGCKVEF